MSELDNNEEELSAGHSTYQPVTDDNGMIRHQLSGMYQGWFLDYASYVILERAVPHFVDGLKPVQRRILHSMKRLDDGRFNKVANIVGHIMQFRETGEISLRDIGLPHPDTSRPVCQNSPWKRCSIPRRQNGNSHMTAATGNPSHFR